MKKNLTIVILAALLTGALTLIIWLIVRPSDKEPEVTTTPARIVDVKAVARLVSMDIYREETVVDTVGSKVICAIAKLRGQITFDLDSLSADPDADTVRIKLPRENIKLYEAVDRGAWQVVDTRSLKFLGSSKLTVGEENAVKRGVIAKARTRLYKDGTVTRTRKEAASNLSQTLSMMLRRPVIVTP
jgi:hypothetical protein